MKLGLTPILLVGLYKANSGPLPSEITSLILGRSLGNFSQICSISGSREA